MELLSTETKTAEIKTPIRSRLETSTFSVVTSSALKLRSPNANLIISKICCLEGLTYPHRTRGLDYSLPGSATSEISYPTSYEGGSIITPDEGWSPPGPWYGFPP